MELDFSRFNEIADKAEATATEEEPLNISQAPPLLQEVYPTMDAGQGEEEEEGELFSLTAQEGKRLSARELSSLVLAFKETCLRSDFLYQVGEDSQGRPRVKVGTKSGRAGGLALLAMEIKLEQEPQLEAALLIELARKNAYLQDVLEERAAIRAADNLPDDEMTIALLTIGADPKGPRSVIPDKRQATGAPAGQHKTREGGEFAA